MYTIYYSAMYCLTIYMYNVHVDVAFTCTCMSMQVSYLMFNLAHKLSKECNEIVWSVNQNTHVQCIMYMCGVIFTVGGQ